VHPQLGTQRARRGHVGHRARRLWRDAVAHRAGSAPKGRNNPFALEVLAAAGIDTAAFCSKSWGEFAAADAAPVQVRWGCPDPSNAEGGDEGKRRAFELTRQAVGYRMQQLLALPLETMERTALNKARADIACT
jgi:arsenate reductase